MTLTRTWDQASEAANFGIPPHLSPRRYRYTAALDNHDPARTTATGIIVWHWQHPRRAGEHATPRAEAWHLSQWSHPGMRDLKRAVFVIDWGRSVVPYWVSGWDDGEPSELYPEGREPYVMLHPFPTSEIIRADDGARADFTGWMLGPRRAYHLKVTPANDD